MKRTISLILILIILFSLTACGNRVPGTVASVTDITGKAIGVVSNTAARIVLGSGAKSYDSVDELAAALSGGSIDCAIADVSIANRIVKAGKGLKILDGNYSEGKWRIAIAKENADLTVAVNNAIVELGESGVLTGIYDYYISLEGEGYIPSDEEYADCLTLAADSSLYPYSYKDSLGEWKGIDIDCVRAICDKLGVGLEINEVSRDALIDEVWYGRAHFAAGVLYSDEESLEKIDFSHAYIISPQKIVVRR